MKHLIMGTAGHIDHGKTTLIKVLTDFDCDTHKEEKKRGITINLGFTYFDLPDGNSIGVVDVPGHKDFVHTMVGGASGIDFVLFVIAADSGVMPQTREHLKIMDLLDIKNGIIALTKTDLVEPELIDLAKEEIEDLVAGTFLEKAEVIPVSSKTMAGIDNLKKAIYQLSKIIPEKPSNDIFRLYIDRIFSVTGFGTVATGSVLSGKLQLEQNLYLLPGDKKGLRVRRLERHGKEVTSIKAGDRASINLVGLERNDFKRGMILSNQKLSASKLIDAKLEIFDYNRNLPLWTQVIFHTGTYEAQAKIHLIDKNELKREETALVQIHLDQSCTLRQGDRFVIRNTSCDTTLGGGVVIDPIPLHHRRRPPKLIRQMQTLMSGDTTELISLEVKKRYEAVSLKDISQTLNIAYEDAAKAVAKEISSDIYKYSLDNKIVLVISKKAEILKKRIVESIEAYHRKNSIDEKGLTFQEMMSRFGLKSNSPGELLLKSILNELKNEHVLKKVSHTWCSESHKVDLDEKTKNNISWLDSYLKNYKMQTPLLSELVPGAKARKITEDELKQLLHYLVRSKKAYVIDGNYIHASIVDCCREKLLKELINRKEGVTVAQFRDIVDGNRKICLLLISFYDGEGVTLRVGDVRVITDKGRAIII